METTKDLNEQFDSLAPRHSGYSSEEKAAARELHSFAKDWAVMTCLLVARRMLAAAKDVEDNEFLTGFAKQEGVEDCAGIAPGFPTDFVLY